ncbi:hypothetical protein SAY87_008281 [Trapa incisa]|uniref:LIM zinc-binding domain-containing protein n=1 Tax=Trapa incisa TaxID=236973 RepID=A0AAN7QG80_9MYRT|nr:hypothetical protein SAY87_008281 [Trapa incisa]
MASSYGGTKQKCRVCEKTVYWVEELTADDRVYHKSCFRCHHCKGTLKLGNYSSYDGVLYCKPHFDQLFKMTGRLDKSFQGNPANVHICARDILVSYCFLQFELPIINPLQVHQNLSTDWPIRSKPTAGSLVSSAELRINVMLARKPYILSKRWLWMVSAITRVASGVLVEGA